MKAVFFDCDKKTEDFICQNKIDGVDIISYPFSLNQSDKIENKDDIDIISVFVHSENIDNNILDLYPNLKMITTRSTGFNHIDLSYTKKRGIFVCNVPNYGEITVAEFTFGLILGLSRKIYKAKSNMKTATLMPDGYIGKDLSGSVLGIIGTGAIGRHVAKLATAFGMKVIAFDPHPNKLASDMGVTYVSLDELFYSSDVISLHCPATNENYHMLDKAAFETMKDGVLIINTARGSLIDTDALYQAIISGKVGGAGLDVLESEDILMHREITAIASTRNNTDFLDSLINMRMMQLDNTIITPHIAFNSENALVRILQTTYDNIRFFKDGKPQNRVD